MCEVSLNGGVNVIVSVTRFSAVDEALPFRGKGPK